MTPGHDSGQRKRADETENDTRDSQFHALTQHHRQNPASFGAERLRTPIS